MPTSTGALRCGYSIRLQAEALRRGSGMTLATIPLAVPVVIQHSGGEADGAAWWWIAGLDMEPRPCNAEVTAPAILEALADQHRVELSFGFTPEDLEAIPADAPGTVVLAFDADPPEREPGWEEPIAIEIAALAWERLGVACLAVPSLDLVVHGADRTAVTDALVRRLHALAERQGPGLRLRWWLRLSAWRLQTLVVDVDIPLKRHGPATAERILAAVAMRAETSRSGPLIGCDAVVERLADAFAARPRRLVVVAGPPGCGKSACIAAALARSTGSERAAWAIDAVRLMVGHQRFPLWSDLLEAVCAEAAEDDAILHLGGLFELCETGQAVGLPFTPADLLRPRLARGEFSAVVEATPEELTRILAQRPGLLAHAEVVRVETPGWPQVVTILRAHLPPARITDAALHRLADLHQRYAPYSAVPGRALRLGRRLVAEHTGAVDAALVESAFAAESGLPLRLIASDRTWPVEEIRAHLAQRVVGQEAAVAAVADAVVLAKSRLDRPGRPLAVLLLAGPTGTGKTSLATALAELLFLDRQRIQRFDLSEYATPAAAARLVGGAGSAEGLLVAAIRRQPAGVLLLDEVEKADPMVHDYLLQLAGEGRLSDARGRHADAAGTVLLLTSNLGSASVGGTALGFATGTAGQVGIGAYHEAIDAAFRPELVNRFDAVLVFTPLDQALVRTVAVGRLQRLESRPGLQRPPHRLQADAAALDQFAEAATDPRWGARGVLRAIDRHVAVPLARAWCGLPDADGRRSATAAASDRHRLRLVAIRAGADGPLVEVSVPGPAIAAGSPVLPGSEPTLADLVRGRGLADADRTVIAHAAGALARQVRRIARSPLIFRLKAAADRARAARRRLHGKAFSLRGAEELRLDAFQQIAAQAATLDLDRHDDLLERLDRDGAAGQAEPEAIAALTGLAKELRLWLQAEVRRRNEVDAPRGWQLIAFHPAALAEAARLLVPAVARIAKGRSGSPWTAWTPGAGGGWSPIPTVRPEALPDGHLVLGVTLDTERAWPLVQALLGHWRLEVIIDGRRQQGLLRIASWPGQQDPPAEALRKNHLPKRADDERSWPLKLDDAIETWLDQALQPLLDEDDGT